nr:uncharacterized protein LOC113688912 [Coffea arabica]
MREAKRNSESSSTDEVGQGELYCPAYALKVETGPQKKQHPPGKAKEKAEQDDTKEVGNESNRRGERKGKNGNEEGHQGRRDEHDHLELLQREESSKPSSKL